MKDFSSSTEGDSNETRSDDHSAESNLSSERSSFNEVIKSSRRKHTLFMGDLNMMVCDEGHKL